MLRTTTLFGVSMVSRKNRRLLVATTYLILVLILSSIALIPWAHDYLPLILGFAFIMSIGLSGRLFHSVVPPTILPAPELISLGLMRKRHQSGEPDERDIAVRNAAYFEAHRLVAVYSLFMCSFLLLSGTRSVPLVLVLPIGGIAPSLPQAVILWTEPDVPEEART